MSQQFHIQVIQEGTGHEASVGKPFMCTTRVGSRMDGFNSSRDRGTPFTFPLGGGRVCWLGKGCCWDERRGKTEADHTS